MKTIVRSPAVAGTFYPKEPDKLREQVKAMLFENKKELVQEGSVQALVVPHAGYVFSGGVAASAYSILPTEVFYKRVFIIGSSHRVRFSGASVYNVGNYRTPIGEIKVDIETANDLIKSSELFDYSFDADAYEHSLEVQLPFLQSIYGEKLQIVPIVIGSQSLNELKEIAKALTPYFTPENLFVISTDFSHYPSYHDALESDKIIKEAIISLSPIKLIDAMEKVGEKKLNGLVTSLCGWSSVYVFLNLLKDDNSIVPFELDYKNSGDSPYGEKDRVVGYWALAFMDKYGKAETMNLKSKDFSLNDSEKQKLLEIARGTIEYYLSTGKIIKIDEKELSSNLHTPCGAFVSLHKHGKLRGCIGRFEPGLPLYKVVSEMAIAASTEDYRFSKVELSELSELKIEISVLTPLKRVYLEDEIILGRHGIYIRKGFRSGTFLPQVATETGWDKATFLGKCSQDKAGLGWDGWKDAELFVYEAIVFGEE